VLSCEEKSIYAPFYYRAPDAYLFICKFEEEKQFKTIDYPVLKAWIDLRQTKKQDWMLLVVFDVVKMAELNEVSH